MREILATVAIVGLIATWLGLAVVDLAGLSRRRGIQAAAVAFGAMVVWLVDYFRPWLDTSPWIGRGGGISW